MNPSAYSSAHTATNVSSCTSIGASYDAIPSYDSYHDSAFSLHEDTSSSTDGWSGGCLALGTWTDADQALFETFLTSEDASTSPFGHSTMVSLPPPYYDQEPLFPLHPPSATQLYSQPFRGSRSHPDATASSQSTISLAFEQTPRETTASPVSSNLIYPPLDYVHDVQEVYATTATAESSRAGHHKGHPSPSSPYPSPSPEPFLWTPSTNVASRRKSLPAHTSHSPISLASEQSPLRMTMTCISPDRIYPCVHSRYDVEDDHSTDVSSHSSCASRRATHRCSSSSPYPSPSPDPSPRTSSIVIASQRRNAPARTAAPVSAKTWQCPHCPYVQRNRRSPDLKRHIRTHTRGADVADWVCCGVLVMNAIELGVPAATVREAQVFEFDGMVMIGGCRRAFSRRDALNRHLQREKGKCFGDALSLHQRGNRETY